MSHQVLARKWRPRVFREMVGQEHVLRALINALDNDRLHHAYLFTGTRGVGKTTVARILAKCLNCEQGVSSEPCDKCSSCTEITEGRSVDLLEVDAASRTKVDQTRELLDNVQYAPTQARYKVYLIDEVHMLSDASFNALLKTLEEPPPHVKFLLATTDPQKLPATVLSRCLQFNLKNMSAELIVGHLKHVLEQEQVKFEEPALWLLGRAADGSMRDALSLTDQAVAFGSGALTEADVRAMLGTVDLSFVYRMAEAVVQGDAEAALNIVAEMSEHAPDYVGTVQEFASLMHRVAVAQAAPGAVDDTHGDAEQVKSLAASMTAEDAQLYYQLAVNGRRDLSLSPDLRAGFEMTLLRMIAFRPALVLQEGAEIEVADGGADGGANNGGADGGPGKSGAAGGPGGSGGRSDAGEKGSAKEKGAADERGAEAAKKPEAGAAASTEPQPAAKSNVEQTNAEQTNTAKSKPNSAEPSAAASAAAKSPRSATTVSGDVPADSSPTTPPSSSASAASAASSASSVSSVSSVVSDTNQSAPAAAPTTAPTKKSNGAAAPDPALFTPDRWPDLLEQLHLNPLLHNIASNCELRQVDGDSAAFVLDQTQSALHSEQHAGQLAAALGDYLGRKITATIEVGTPTAETPQTRGERQDKEWRARVQRSIESNPTVQLLLDRFGATVDPASITPVEQRSDQ